jgi:myo-inositol-1(or 4)-monophosphatase
LSDCVVACGIPHLGRGDVNLSRREIGAVQVNVAALRHYGATALDLAFVAAGRFDAYWDRILKPWDLAAGIILVREAGGYVSDCEGGDDMFDKEAVLAGNEAISKEMLRVLKAAKA